MFCGAQNILIGAAFELGPERIDGNRVDLWEVLGQSVGSRERVRGIGEVERG